MSNPEIKGDPIPVRFEPPEEFMIETLARKTGFSRSGNYPPLRKARQNPDGAEWPEHFL